MLTSDRDNSFPITNVELVDQDRSAPTYQLGKTKSTFRPKIHHKRSRNNSVQRQDRSEVESDELHSIPYNNRNRHNEGGRSNSRKRSKSRQGKAQTTKREDDILNDLLPSSSLSEKPNKPHKKIKKRETGSEFDKRRSKTPKRSKSQEDTANSKKMEPDRGDRAHNETMVDEMKELKKEKPKPTTLNLIRLPVKLLAVLVELHLLWWFTQFAICIWVVTKVDWKLRVRTPVEEYPGYNTLRMPWIPGQIEMRNRLIGVWITLLFVYLPATIWHLSSFLDHQHKKKEPKLWTGVLEKKPWYTSDIYIGINEPKRRQLATALMFLLTLGFLIYYLIVLLSDTFYPMQEAYWDRTIKDWLYASQQYYYLEFRKLSQFIPKEHRITSYHTPDDGSGPYLIIDLVQSMFQCCGLLDGSSDWKSPHVYRPRNHTYRRAMEIPLLYERAHYLVPTLTNDSIPFSCCKQQHSMNALEPVPCDHIRVKDPSGFYSRGCVKPLSNFIQVYWMGQHLLPLALVILTMIPQLILLLATIQLKELRVQTMDAIERLKEYIEEARLRMNRYGQDVFSVLSRTSGHYSVIRKSLALFKEDDEDEEEVQGQDIYKAVRAQVAASEKHIYDPLKAKSPERRVQKKRDAKNMQQLDQNVKPSNRLESRQSLDRPSHKKRRTDKNK